MKNVGADNLPNNTLLIRGKRCNNRPLACRDTAYHFQYAVPIFIRLVVRGINILCSNNIEYCPGKRPFLITKIHTPVFGGNPTEDTVNNGVIYDGSQHLPGLFNADTALDRFIFNHHLNDRVTVHIFRNFQKPVRGNLQRVTFLRNDIALWCGNLLHRIIPVF
ncbi:hypothetical protein IMSAGC012_03451 [Lachnospiraceae bacterium]|nr:hypothetical protein IMSAGC012_03451 [Lachnospiraceae bacterium]